MSELASRKRYDIILDTLDDLVFTSCFSTEENTGFILALQDNFLKNCVTAENNSLIRDYCAYILATGHYPTEKTDLSSAQSLAEDFFNKNFGKILNSLPNGRLRLVFGVQNYDYVKNSTTHNNIWMDTGEYHILYLDSRKVHNKTAIPEILEFLHRHHLKPSLCLPNFLKENKNYYLEKNLWVPLYQSDRNVPYFSFTPIDNF